LGGILADGASAGRGLLLRLHFPAAHDVVAGEPGLAVSLPLAFGDDLLGLPRRGQCGVDVPARVALAALGRRGVRFRLFHGRLTSGGFGVRRGVMRLLFRVQRRQLGVRVPAAKLGVGHQRPLTVQFGGRTPGPAGRGDLRQGFSVGADLLRQRTAFLCLTARLRPFGLVGRGVRPIPRAHRVGTVGVLREVRLPQLPGGPRLRILARGWILDARLVRPPAPFPGGRGVRAL
jgi:hypothetical protein